MSDDFSNNMRIQFFEEFGNHRKIDISIKGGTATGIIISSRIQFENWLVKEKIEDEARGFFAMFPDNKLLPIAIMKSISTGACDAGTDLMSAFLNDVSDAKNVVVLSADDTSANWYTNWGFTHIRSNEHSIMVLNNY